MALDISGLNFFMPVFSFLFVFVVIYAILAVSKVLGENKFVHLLISFIIAVIFMSFSSLELYVRTIIPWFIVLLIVVFLVLIIGFFMTKDFEKIVKPSFVWVVIIVLIIIFLIAAIRVFNPVFHPDLGVASGQGTSLIEQIRDYAGSGLWGSIILLIIAGIVAWIITKK